MEKRSVEDVNISYRIDVIWRVEDWRFVCNMTGV